MFRLVVAVLEMIGAASVRRVLAALVLVLVGSLALGGAFGFGAVAIYQSLLERFAPWQAACLIGGALALVGAVACWIGSARLRRQATLRDVRGAFPSLDSLASLLGSGRHPALTPLQMVAVAALVGFALGRRR